MKKKLIAVRLKQSSVETLKQWAALKEETVSEVIRDLVEKLVEKIREDQEFQKFLEVKAKLRKKGKKS
jgi:Arc/MetJ-type ribon-helix-helix transcriptional regulator